MLDRQAVLREIFANVKTLRDVVLASDMPKGLIIQPVNDDWYFDYERAQLGKSDIFVYGTLNYYRPGIAQPFREYLPMHLRSDLCVGVNLPQTSKIYREFLGDLGTFSTEGKQEYYIIENQKLFVFTIP